MSRRPQLPRIVREHCPDEAAMLAAVRLVLDRSPSAAAAPAPQPRQPAAAGAAGTRAERGCRTERECGEEGQEQEVKEGAGTLLASQ